MTPLMLAAKAGHARVMLLLIMSGATESATNQAGHTPLIMAAENGKTEAAEVLIELGRMPLLSSKLSRLDREIFAKFTPEMLKRMTFDIKVNHQDMTGETALMKAAKAGHTDVSKMLKIRISTKS